MIISFIKFMNQKTHFKIENRRGEPDLHTNEECASYR